MTDNFLRTSQGRRRYVLGLVVYLRKLVVRLPWLKKVILRLLMPFPAFAERLHTLGQSSTLGAAGGFDEHSPPPDPSVLPSLPSVPDALLLPGADSSQQPWVRLIGHVEGHYSMAIVNRGLAAALDQLTGQQLSFVPYHGEPYTQPPSLTRAQQAQVGGALQRSVPQEEERGCISIVHHYPFIADTLPSGVRGIFFAWEETAVPPATVAHIQANFDLVWATSAFVKRALINSGCSVPIFVVPEGIDHLITDDVPPMGELSVPAGQRFRFLHVSSAFDRKGVDVLLTAYLEAFSADDDVELYIKTFPNPHNQVHAQLKQLSQSHARPARVLIDEQPLDDTGMLSLYRSAHAMVLPARGEGFNLPAAEALALGLPLITTGYSGHADFCALNTALLIPFQFAASRSHLRSSDSCWVEPSPRHLAALMRQVHGEVLNASEQLQQRRQAGMRHVRDTYSWHTAGQAILNSAHWLQQQPPTPAQQPLRMALVGTWDMRCGIADYTRNLLEPGLRSGQIELSVYANKGTRTPADNVKVSWDIDDTQKVLDTLADIAASDADVVFLQHHPGFFPLSEPIVQRMLALKMSGRVVVLELHSVLPLLQERRPSAVAIEALAKIDRIIVHKVEDLNYLLALGLCDNVMLLPLGVVKPLGVVDRPAIRQQMGIESNALVLGFFGFALEHKGIDSLIKAIKPLEQATGRPVHLVAVSSVMDERSVDCIERCRRLSDQLDVAGQVHWHTEYLPIERCQALLSAADFTVFPYKHTRESASAAVTVGLSVLSPVLVSELDIFSDLEEVTIRMNGHQPGDVVQTVVRVLGDRNLAAELLERQQQWLVSRDWDVLWARLLNVFQGLRNEHRISEAENG